MTELSQTFNLRNLLYPKCPYNNSVVILILRIGVIALGTFGLSFLNLCVAKVYLVYSIVFNLLVWPIIHCQYCYYKVKKTTLDNENGKIVQNLLPIDEWKKYTCQNTLNAGKHGDPPI